MEPEPAVQVHKLVSAFGDRVIHDGLNLTVRRGEVLGVVGGSGTGKSVLLNSIIGLRTPQEGRINVLGVDVHNSSVEDRQSLERRWGVMFQQGALFSSLTVRENVAAPLREHARLSNDMIEELAELKIMMVGLPQEAAMQRPAELSGGMRKRAGIARALALDPELLFLDEPTAGLDPIGASAFDSLIRELSDALNLTVVMITHDLDTLYAICDRVAVLADKRVVATEPLSVLEQSDHPWIREYFLGPRGRAAEGAALEHRPLNGAG